VSAGAVDEISVAQMAPRRSSSRLANPTPEVAPDVAHRHAAVVPPAAATTRIRSTTCWRFRASSPAHSTPGPFDHREHEAGRRGALGEVVAGELAPDKIVPTPFDPRVVPAVAGASPSKPSPTSC